MLLITSDIIGVCPLDVYPSSGVRVQLLFRQTLIVL